MHICTENPDYFYCTQFLNIENISRDDFTKGINEYINKKKSEEEEKRHEGILEYSHLIYEKTLAGYSNICFIDSLSNGRLHIYKK